MEKQSRARKNRNNSNIRYGRYLRGILRQEGFKEMRLSHEFIEIMDSFIKDIFDRILDQSSQLVKSSRKKTLTARDVQFATRLVLRGDLARCADIFAQRAIIRLNSPHSPDTSVESPDLMYQSWRSNILHHSSPINGSLEESQNSEVSNISSLPTGSNFPNRNYPKVP